jgi:hypothetical protein
LPLHYGSAVADPAGTPVTLVNPIDEDNPNVVIGKIIAAILGIVGSLALLMFVYGGLTWMTAAGNKDRVTKGKDVLVWATLGLVVIFSSYALINFILSGLGVNNDTSPDP